MLNVGVGIGTPFFSGLLAPAFERALQTRCTMSVVVHGPSNRRHPLSIAACTIGVMKSRARSASCIAMTGLIVGLVIVVAKIVTIVV